MKRLLLIALLALIFLTACPVQAVNVSFSSIDGAADRDMYLYQGGVFVGLYNTTSTAIDLTQDTEIIFRPQTANPLESPADFLSTSFTYVQTNVLGLIVIVFLIALYFRR